MKVVILAGGKGTRISEESKLRPKPMVEIGGKPILWHIMKWYSHYGFNEFIICCGYKGHMIKDYFVNYYVHNRDIKLELSNGSKQTFNDETEPWKVTLVDTGLESLTSERILKVKEYIGDETFMLTYGDGVSDIDVLKLIKFHKKENKVVTISTLQPEGRFGALKLSEEGKEVLGFKEKARTDQSWVNIGFMVMEPEVFSYLGDGESMLETIPFEKLIKDNQMSAYKHTGFWSPMDNVHDRDYLERLWKESKAPWRVF